MTVPQADGGASKPVSEDDRKREHQFAELLAELVASMERGPQSMEVAYLAERLKIMYRQANRGKRRK